MYFEVSCSLRSKIVGKLLVEVGNFSLLELAHMRGGGIGIGWGN